MQRSNRGDRTGDTREGLNLILRLDEVMPEKSDEEIRVLYESVQSHLRVPFVNFVFRVLANYPSYLAFAWSRLELHLLTTRSEEAADALRARALAPPVPDRSGVDFAELEDIEQIRGFTDTIHYVLPKLLLVVSAFDEGLGNEQGAEDRSPEAVVPSGVAEGTMSLPMVTSDQTTRRIEKIFEEIRERHGHPDVASYYRGLAGWPAFLELVWERISPLVGTEPYEVRKRDLLEVSRRSVLELPLPSSSEVIERGVIEGQIAGLRAILAVFRFRVIVDTFLDVSLIRAILDGPESTRYSRFSFANR